MQGQGVLALRLALGSGVPAAAFPDIFPETAPEARAVTEGNGLEAGARVPARRAAGYSAASVSPAPSRIRKRSTSPVTVSRKPPYSSSE